MADSAFRKSNPILFGSLMLIVVLLLMAMIVYFIDQNTDNNNIVTTSSGIKPININTSNINTSNINTSDITAVTGQVISLSDVEGIPDTAFTNGVVSILTMEQAIATLNFLGQETGRPLIAPRSILTSKNISEAGFESVDLNSQGEYYYELEAGDYVVCVADPFTEIDGFDTTGISILKCQEATITEGEQLQLDFELGLS